MLFPFVLFLQLSRAKRLAMSQNYDFCQIFCFGACLVFFCYVRALSGFNLQASCCHPFMAQWVWWATAKPSVPAITGSNQKHCQALVQLDDCYHTPEAGINMLHSAMLLLCGTEDERECPANLIYSLRLAAASYSIGYHPLVHPKRCS